VIPSLRASRSDDALAADDPETAAALRAVLTAAGYTREGIAEALGSAGERIQRQAAELPIQLRELEGGGTLATLVRLFRIGVPVPVAEAEAALAPLGVGPLQAIGLLERDGGAVGALATIVPTPEVLHASDWEEDDRLPAHADHVVGVSASSRVLARLVPRRPVPRALDLGTGAGIQALLCARHAERVVAVDVSPRALRFARFNCRLNGVENVDLREGSLFDPVGGERFPLIVANPPYVISPESDYVFRDSGLPGDSFCEALVRALPDHLDGGGIAVTLLSWTHGATGDATAPVAGWLAGRGCDAILLHYASSDPLTYAAGWNRLRGGDPAERDAGMTRWIAYLEELGAERVAWGALVVRRRADAAGNWFWAHDPSADELAPAGHHVERLIAAQDLLARLPDGRALLDERLAPAPDVRLEQTLRLGRGGAEVEGIMLRLEDGLQLRVVPDEATAQLLLRLDGRRPLGEAVRALVEEAGLRGATPEGALPGLRRLVELGFLVPAG
jgi:methylase of polypeptide subunit release factors